MMFPIKNDVDVGVFHDGLNTYKIFADIFPNKMECHFCFPNNGFSSSALNLAKLD